MNGARNAMRVRDEFVAAQESSQPVGRRGPLPLMSKHNKYTFTETPDIIQGASEEMYTEDSLPRDWVNCATQELLLNAYGDKWAKAAHYARDSASSPDLYVSRYFDGYRCS